MAHYMQVQMDDALLAAENKKHPFLEISRNVTRIEHWQKSEHFLP
ncbi:hypothetical protein PsAD37_04288 [Pseudovibrio sp. Ad37]|nr:hypothetical protein PsAD37_04288 [Pseudovibrio sp. Ad37]